MSKKLEKLLWYISSKGIDYIESNASHTIFNGISFTRMRKYNTYVSNTVFLRDGIFPAVFGEDYDKYRFYFYTYETKQGPDFLVYEKQTHSFHNKILLPEDVHSFIVGRNNIDMKFYIPLMFSSVKYQKDIVKIFIEDERNFRIHSKMYPLLHAIFHRTNTKYSVDLSNDDILDDMYTISIGIDRPHFVSVGEFSKIYLPVSHIIIGGMLC